MPETRDLQKNQESQQKQLDKNTKNAEKSIAKDYLLAFNLMRAELLKVIERVGKINNETMSKFNRRQKLLKAINKNVLIPLFGSVRRKTRRTLDAQFKQSYFRNSWTVDTNLGVAFKWKLKK